MIDSIIQFFIQFDQWLFERINQDASNQVFDSFFPVFTELLKLPAVIYLVIPALLAVFLFKLRLRFISLVLALAAAIAITDASSHHLIKKSIERERPSQTIGLAVTLRTFPHAGKSFPSNHAANCFAGAFVLSFFFFKWRFCFYLFAFTVALSRLYVGVHFLLDVIFGALWGSLVAFLVMLMIAPLDRRLNKSLPDFVD